NGLDRTCVSIACSHKMILNNTFSSLKNTFLLPFTPLFDIFINWFMNRNGSRGEVLAVCCKNNSDWDYGIQMQ
ncbi:hypothetical protein, partial [Nitrosomonas sp.]|uniref:hypothetical protein n=1 Tax=Nitrosomonas sp. TaxID=42353 RepID=UPI0025F38E2E